MISGTDGQPSRCRQAFTPTVVQERLGHANIGITMDVYSHVIAGLHEDAAEQVAALFRGPVSNPLAEST
jgi:integrase